MPEIAGDMEGIKRAWLKLRGREAHPSPTLNEPNPSKYRRGDPRAVLLRAPDPAPAPRAAAPPRSSEFHARNSDEAGAAAEGEPALGFYKGPLGRPYTPEAAPWGAETAGAQPNRAPRATDVQKGADGRFIEGHPLHVEALPPDWHCTQVVQRVVNGRELWTATLNNPFTRQSVKMGGRTLRDAKTAARAGAWELHRDGHSEREAEASGPRLRLKHPSGMTAEARGDGLALYQGNPLLQDGNARARLEASGLSLDEGGE